MYHLISRTVNGEWLFGTVAKEVFRRQMWQIADFAGLEILTYAVMSNHFHILVRVPKEVPISDDELLRRYHVLYPKPTRYQTAQLAVVAAELKRGGPHADRWRARQLSLMNDVSAYMKLLKERFSIWYNQRHGRFGPVWSDRFKSVLIEPKGRTIEMMAAYIDLNCVRAGAVKDPKDYRYCGYAEAVAGNVRAQRGLQSVIGGAWFDTHAAYRMLLFTKGAGPRAGSASITPQQVRDVVRLGGKLALPDVLRCRVRYFSTSAALGGREFIERQVADYRRRFRVGARVARRNLPAVTDWGDLAGLRQVSGELFG
ncbi:MAG TPA: transposase [Opitutaceae bacterium]|nr:transposase [Opitutaceae bacterium]